MKLLEVLVGVALGGTGCAAEPVDPVVTIPSFDIAMPAADANLSLPAGSTIVTDTGLVLDRAGAPLALESTLVPQPGGPDIRVFEANAITLDDVSIRGTLPIAFVASGPLLVTGNVDAGAHGAVGGPGAVTSGPMVGTLRVTNSEYTCGGGGNGTAGAAATGGAAFTGDVLVGGGGGGHLDAALGGAGGGAIQLVSMDSIRVAGTINAGGGGGPGSEAGGAGGTIVLESPSVTVDGMVAANGGGGGASCGPGSDGLASTTAASGAACDDHGAGGDGGTGSSAPMTGTNVFTPALHDNGGAGGAAGRIVVKTTRAAFEPDATTMSGVITVETLPHRR